MNSEPWKEYPRRSWISLDGFYNHLLNVCFNSNKENLLKHLSKHVDTNEGIDVLIKEFSLTGHASKLSAQLRWITIYGDPSECKGWLEYVESINKLDEVFANETDLSFNMEAYSNLNEAVKYLIDNNMKLKVVEDNLQLFRDYLWKVCLSERMIDQYTLLNALRKCHPKDEDFLKNYRENKKLIHETLEFCALKRKDSKEFLKILSNALLKSQLANGD